MPTTHKITVYTYSRQKLMIVLHIGKMIRNTYLANNDDYKAYIYIKKVNNINF